MTHAMSCFRKNLPLLMLAAFLTACVSSDTDNRGAKDASTKDATVCTAPIAGGGTSVEAFADETINGVPDFVPWVCAKCEVKDPEAVIDFDPDNYALIDRALTAGYAIAGIAVRAQRGIIFPAGNIAGFTISIPAALVSAAVLPRIDIIAGGTSDRFEYASYELSTPVVDVAGLMANEKRFFLGLHTTGPFNWLVIGITGAADALTEIRVYQACSDATDMGGFPASATGAAPGGTN